MGKHRTNIKMYLDISPCFWYLLGLHVGESINITCRKICLFTTDYFLDEILIWSFRHVIIRNIMQYGSFLFVLQGIFDV